jgi:hypothetical protein
MPLCIIIALFLLCSSGGLRSGFRSDELIASLLTRCTQTRAALLDQAPCRLVLRILTRLLEGSELLLTLLQLDLQVKEIDLALLPRDPFLVATDGPLGRIGPEEPDDPTKDEHCTGDRSSYEEPCEY